ncbi:SWIM zinc finger domain-containing protein [Vibrio vulnificus]|nr:SWIM zinc finger domain-containing protein [Vibrio vulnificus]EHU4994541.1 SWIM zinc finger domain-containing protein [Vibrio vulnificus]
MNASTTRDIDIVELMALCENSTLQKGIQLSHSGAVHKLTMMGNTATAQVKGSNVYQVSLDFTGDLIAACTCPAAQYQRLCKHSVAVAMSLIEQPQLNQESERETIKKHLQSLGEETRLEMLLDYLEEDEYAWNALLTKIEIREKPAVYGELKKLVTQALPREQLWDWRESHAYFHSAENQLSMIIESMQSLDTEQQWKLINYLVERLNKVLEQIDDSSGDRFGIESLINEHMPNILAKLNWSEQEKAHWMFEHLTHHEFDVFPSIEENFAVVWQNNTYFLDLCRQAIEQASPDESGWNLRSWANPLIKQSPNWRDVVAIKQKIARTCRDFLEIVEMYIDNQAPLEAEFWLAKARKITSEYERQACDQAQFRLYVELGEIKSAWSLANRLLERSPSFQRYKDMVQFKANYSVDDAEFLPRVELLFKNSYRLPDQFNRVSEQTDALVLFYIDNQQFDQACEWVASNRVSTNALLTLADLVVHDKPNHALSYYLRVVTVQIEQTNNEAYATALTLLQKIEGLLKSHSAELAQFYVEIASLAQSYKRKRNMLTLLKQHYAAHL